MENKEIMVSVPLEQYRKGIMALARIEAFAAYINCEKYSIDREMSALMLDFLLQEKNE